MLKNPRTIILRHPRRSIIGETMQYDSALRKLGQFCNHEIRSVFLLISLPISPPGEFITRIVRPNIEIALIITRYLAAHIQFHRHRHHHPRRHRRRTIVNASGNESASSAKGNVTITKSTRRSTKDRRVKLSWSVYHRNLGGRKSRLLSRSEVGETNGLIRGCDANPRAPFVAIRRPDDLVGNRIPLARRIHQRGMIFRSARRCSVSFNGRRGHIQDTLQKETTMVSLAAAHLIGEKLFIFSYFIFIFYLYSFVFICIYL